MELVVEHSGNELFVYLLEKMPRVPFSAEFLTGYIHALTDQVRNITHRLQSRAEFTIPELHNLQLEILDLDINMRNHHAFVDNQQIRPKVVEFRRLYELAEKLWHEHQLAHALFNRSHPLPPPAIVPANEEAIAMSIDDPEPEPTATPQSEAIPVTESEMVIETGSAVAGIIEPPAQVAPEPVIELEVAYTEENGPHRAHQPNCRNYRSSRRRGKNLFYKSGSQSQRATC